MKKLKLTKKDVGKSFKTRGGGTVKLEEWDDKDVNVPARDTDYNWYTKSGEAYTTEERQDDLVAPVTRGRPRKVKEAPNLSLREITRQAEKVLEEVAKNPKHPVYMTDIENEDKLDEVAIWLIRNGHKEAGIALLTEYKP
jgi:hypothetical protein